MSLVITLAASREAVIGADRRAIAFLGSCPKLEEELYSGQIENDQKLADRARELGAILQISDGREKVWRRGDLLVGEVTEISAKLSRRRRIYLVPGASLQVDITSGEDAGAKGADAEGAGGEARIRAWDGVGCIVFGNRITQKLAYEEVGRAGGRVNEALIKSILEKAGERTASVSREHIVLRSNVKKADPKASLLKALEEDCKESGWRLCALQ
ncbi:MAG: MJ0548 connectase family domain-containing protein [Methanothrix sp.]